VTGNVAVDTDTLFVDSVNNRVGIGTASPLCMLTIDGGIGVHSGGGVLGIRQKGDTNDDGITLTSSHGNSTRMYKDANGHFNLHNTGGGQFTFENVTGNVGIGTTSPDAKLHVNGNAIIGDIGAVSGLTHQDAQLTLGGTHNTGYNNNNQIKLLITGGNNDGGSPYYIMCEDENGYDQFYVKGATSEGGSGTMYLKGNAEISGYLKTGHPAFYAYRTAPGNADESYITYNDTYVNIGSHINLGTGTFTCPVAGIYTFTWGAIGKNTDGVYRYYIRKNNSQIDDVHLRLDNTATGSEYGDGERTAMLSLAANDTIRIYFKDDAGTGADYGYNYTYFQGHLISSI